MVNTKRMLAMLLGIVMLISLLAACGGDTQTSAAPGADAGSSAEAGNEASTGAKEINVALPYDAYTLDPANCDDDASSMPIMLINEALLRESADGMIPGLAESWEHSDDNLEWTFHLRRSTWADGTPLTANDLYYSMMRILDPENGLALIDNLIDIEGAEDYVYGEGSLEDVGIEAVDDYTLRLKYRYPAFEQDFSDYVFMPANQAAVEKGGEAYGAEADTVLCNGPFVVTSWVHDSEIVLEKNPNYWNADAIHLDKVVFKVGAVDDTAVDMLLTGALDASTFTTADSRDEVLNNPGFSALTGNGGAQFIHINTDGLTEETGAWLSNVNFRKALSAALDRDALVRAVYTTDTAAYCLVPETEMGVNDLFNKEFDTGSWSTTQDVEAAQQYLYAAMEDLGVSDVSEIPTFTMLAFDSDNNVTCLNAVADMWDKTLGIHCELDMETITSMLDKAYSGQFDFWKGGTSINRDVFDVMYTYSDAYGDDVCNRHDAEFDALYEKVMLATDWADRKSALAEIGTYWTENMLDLEVTWMNDYLVYSDRITGVTCNGAYFDFTFADIVG